MSGAVELYLLRHAHAGDRLAWERPDDVRPLSKKGRAQADRLATYLRGIAFRPDVVISSPKLRATQTAEPIAEALGLTVRTDERLGGLLDLAALEGILADAGDPARVVLVGHDPDFSELVAVLCDTAGAPMRKGALARIDAARPLQPGGGTLRWLLTPDLLTPEG